MKIVATADFHGYLPEVPPCDVLVIAGDVTPLGEAPPGWWDRTFRRWLEAQPVGEAIIGVAGNHDWDLYYRTAPDDLPWTYLEDEGVTIDGTRFWGTPWQIPFKGWAFNADESTLEGIFRGIPNDTNVIVAHGPPRGLGDRTVEGEHVGSTAMRRAFDRVDPALLVCGHIHAAYGQYGAVANVAHVNEAYRPVNAPVVFEL